MPPPPLADACPRKVYRAEDAEFRDRVRRAYMITMTVALNLRAGQARLRMAEAFRETANLFAGEVAKFATAAYLCGRANGRAEAGLTASPGNPDAVAKELVAGGFEQQKMQICDVAEEVVRRLADTLHEEVVEADGADVAAQWDGYGWFCREVLGVEPATVAAAFGVGGVHVAAELAREFPDAKPDEAEAARWATGWSRGWDRRFDSVRP